MSRRGISIKEQIALMSMRGKITILIACVATIALAFTCTYITLAKEGEEEVVQEEQNVVNEDDVELNTSYIEFVDEVEENNTTNEVANNTVEENKVKKEVTYKGKKVEVPKAEVAPANSAEDSQKQKSGGENISAADAVAKFENDGQSAGIDVSAHQGKIDWAQVRNSGIEFAMIRCGFRGQTAGAIYEDAYFKTNIKNAVNNGVKVGIYFYSTAVNEEEALQEAAWVVETIKSYRITYPVAYDFEDFGRYRCAGVSGSQATSNAVTFLNYVSSKGYQPMMYANKSDITGRFEKGRLPYKFWLAHYTSATNYTGSYQMWQYTSSGSVPGISGRVDMNVAYFRYGAVAEAKHTHDFSQGSVIKTPESKDPTCTEDGVKFVRCKDCSENEKQVIPKLGHKFGDYQVTKEPTETEFGVKTRECTVCHFKEDAQVPKKPASSSNNTNTNTNNTTEPTHAHDFENGKVLTDTATCTEKGMATVKCKDCDETTQKESQPKGHNFGDWKVETPATVESLGKEIRTCKTCGETESRDIPKLPAEEKPTEPPVEAGTSSGEETN